MSVLVSINCITYNHENYISYAIDSFLMQKTNFEYEILIGEDCSTDNTRKIVNEYVERYPNIVKMVTDDKNVGIIKNTMRLIEKSEGKYIAICEGDDYWVDENKLQKQIDFMMENPDCSMCYHSAEIINVKTNSKVGLLRPYKKTGILPSNELFFGGGDDVPTASIVFLREYMLNPPQFATDCPVGDHTIALILSYHGRIGYIDKVMSVRNIWIPNSWSTNFNLVRDDKKKITHIRAIIKLLQEYDVYSMNKYTNQIKKRILAGEMEILQIQSKNPFSDDKFLNLLNSFRKLERFIIKTSYRMPELSGRFRRLKGYIRSFLV